jgi:hypothetical protein
MAIPLAIAGIYNFSQKVIGFRSTCFAFEVSACIIFLLWYPDHLREAEQNYFYHINLPNRLS